MERTIRRGSIYWIENQNAVGRELPKARPAVILREPSGGTVTVVYLSLSQQRELHNVSLGAHGTALCEHIYTVDVSLVGDYVCCLDAGSMERVTAAVMSALGLTSHAVEKTEEIDAKQFNRLQGEINAYRECYGLLLRRLIDLAVE